MAYQALHSADASRQNLQYVVAQAMMAAWKMGREGKAPPRPAYMEPRRRPEPEPDPEIDAIYQEMLMLSWSPLSGQPRPEGHVKWSMQRHAQRRQSERVEPEQKAAVRPVIRRR